MDPGDSFSCLHYKLMNNNILKFPLNSFFYIFVSLYFLHSICVKLFSFDFHLCLNYHSLMDQDSNQDFVDHLLPHRNRNIYVTFKFMGFNTQTHHIKVSIKGKFPKFRLMYQKTDFNLLNLL